MNVCCDFVYGLPLVQCFISLFQALGKKKEKEEGSKKEEEKKTEKGKDQDKDEDDAMSVD